MAKDVDAVGKQSVEAVQKPVNDWRQNIAEADAIVAKPARHYRAWVFQGYLIGAVVVFIILAVLAKTVAYFTFDVTITQALQTFHPGWFDALMYTLSWIGFAPQAWMISVVVILFLLVSGLKWETVVTTVSLIGSSLLVVGIKVLVDRPRPTADLVNVITQLNSYSFPSGHVVFFTTFIGFLLFLVYILLKQSVVAHRAAGHSGRHGGARLGYRVSTKGSIGPAMYSPRTCSAAFGSAYRFLSTVGASRAIS